MDLSKMQENGVRGQKALDKLFQMTDKELKDWLSKYITINDKEQFLDSASVTRVIKDEQSYEIDLWFYDNVHIGWFGVSWKNEYGAGNKELINEETFYALLGE